MLVSPTSLIPRPPARDFDTTNVIKADQLRAWHQRFQEKSTTAAALVGSLLNMRGAATLEEFARKLARQHRPSDPLALPEFMRPRAEVAAAPAAEPRRDPEPAAPPASSAPASVAAPADAGERRKLICATCGARITFAEGRFCWNDERRFGGLQYCRRHQAGFR